MKKLAFVITGLLFFYLVVPAQQNQNLVAKSLRFSNTPVYLSWVNDSSMVFVRRSDGKVFRTSAPLFGIQDISSSGHRTVKFGNGLYNMTFDSVGTFNVKVNAVSRLLVTAANVRMSAPDNNTYVDVATNLISLNAAGGASDLIIVGNDSIGARQKISYTSSSPGQINDYTLPHKKYIRDTLISQQVHDSLAALGTIKATSTPGTPMASTSGANIVIRTAVNSPTIQYEVLTDSTYRSYLRDTTTLYSFGAGIAAAGDTAAFTTSSLYGAFFNSTTDTIVVTRFQVGLLGTSPSINVKLWFNDSLAVTAGATAIVNAGNTCTNTAGGTSVTAFDNAKIPPGVWVWLSSPSVTTKPTYLSLSLIGFKKKTN